MNLNDMISLIQARLGFRTDLQAEITKEINLAQYKLERDVTFNPYFLWRGSDICIQPDCINYALPPGFIRLCEFNGPLFHENGCPRAIELKRSVAFIAYAMDNSVGPITHYTVQDRNLRLNRRGCGILRLFYITATTPLSESNLTNLWTEKAFDLLMNAAGLQVAMLTRDPDAVNYFSANYSVALTNFKRECVAFEDYGYEIARLDSLYSEYNMPVGGWYDPVSGCLCTCPEPEPEPVPDVAVTFEHYFQEIVEEGFSAELYITALLDGDYTVEDIAWEYVLNGVPGSYTGNQSVPGLFVNWGDPFTFTATVTLLSGQQASISLEGTVE